MNQPTYLWRGRACTVMYRSHGEALIRMADSLAIRIVPLAELTRPVGDACPNCGSGGTVVWSCATLWSGSGARLGIVKGRRL